LVIDGEGERIGENSGEARGEICGEGGTEGVLRMVSVVEMGLLETSEVEFPPNIPPKEHPAKRKREREKRRALAFIEKEKRTILFSLCAT
jgi:hypothetical protein